MKYLSKFRPLTAVMALILSFSATFSSASEEPLARKEPSAKNEPSVKNAPSTQTLAPYQFPFDKLQTYLDSLAENNKLMSAVYIAKNGKPLYEHYAGMASVKDKVELSADSRFRIGSITKTFTAVLIMQLVEQNKISLDDTLRKYFTERFQNSGKITLRHLLQHRSGIPNFTNQPAYMNYMTRPQKPETMLKRVLTLDSEFEPGSEHRYSNSNYLLLGLIIEIVYGKPFAEVVAEKITKPLGLNNTYYGNSINIEENEALSYRFGGQWVLQPETHMTVPHAAGAMVATAKDTAKFMEALFTGKLVSDTSLKAMMELKDGYGFGLFALPFHAHTFYGHNGGIDGFVSAAGFNMADGISYAILSNGVNFSFDQALIAIASSVYGLPFEIPDLSAKPVTLPVDKLKMAEGEYVSANHPLDIKMFVSGGELLTQASGQGSFPLTPYSDTEFRFDPAGIIIKFNADTKHNNHFTEFELNQGGGKFIFTKKD